MSLPPSVRIGLDALRSNLLRTALSTLGVIMGVASLVAVLSIGDGLESFARSQIERTTDLQTVGVAPRIMDRVDGLAIPRSDWPRFTAADVDAMQAVIGARGTVSISVMGRAAVRSAGADSVRAATVMATDSAGVAALPVELAHGRFFTAAEAARGEALAIVNDRLAASLAGSEGGTAGEAALLGRSIELQGTPFRIIGVLKELDQPTPYNGLLVPFATAERALVAAPGMPLAPSLAARLDRVEDADSVRAQIGRWSTARWGDDVQLQASSQQRLEQVATGMLIFKLAMGSFAAIAILVGGIGIMNVLLASVFERTREIGVRKAIGARNRDILTQFLAESVAISGAGSLFGAVLGLAGAFAVTAIMRSQTDAQVYAAITLGTLLVATLVAVVTGLAFGLYPALRAARLSPIDAIRHE